MVDNERFVILSNGKRIKIDLGEGEHYSHFSKTVLIGKDVEMKKIWYVSFLKADHTSSSSTHEFVSEHVYGYEPTPDQLLYEMSVRGLGMYDIVTVDTGYMMRYSNDEPEDLE
jgi:hypothetical protein